MTTTTISFFETGLLLQTNNPYEIHQKVWDLASNGTNLPERPFLYRVDPLRGQSLVQVRTRDESVAERMRATRKTLTVKQGVSYPFSLRLVPERRQDRRVIATPRNDDAVPWFRDAATKWGFEPTRIDTAESRGLVFYGRQRRRITLNDTLFEGVLRITELDACICAMSQGIGRRRGLGFGMLQLVS